MPNLEFGQPGKAVGLHIKAHVIAQNSFTESAVQAQLVQDMMDSPTWGGLNAVLNQILALELQPGVSCADINNFEGCATTAEAANAGIAAYDPTLPDCFTTTHDTFVVFTRKCSTDKNCCPLYLFLVRRRLAHGEK